MTPRRHDTREGGNGSSTMRMARGLSDPGSQADQPRAVPYEQVVLLTITLGQDASISPRAAAVLAGAPHQVAEGARNVAVALSVDTHEPPAGSQSNVGEALVDAIVTAHNAFGNRHLFSTSEECFGQRS